MVIINILILSVRGPSLYVGIWRIKTVPALKGLNMSSDCLSIVSETQQAWNIEQMLGLCWADIVDGGPTLAQHRFNISC